MDESLDGIAAVFLDLDGTIYLGDGLIEGASQFLDRLEEHGIRRFFLSNNSSKSVSQYLEKLGGMSLESFEEVVRTNLTSAFVTLSVACKQMLRNGGGRVVFTSSVAGSLGLVNHEAVSAAKGGVESMARSAASTYARRGIRVNVVAPGLTDTRLSAPITSPDASKRAAVGMIPLRRINLPEEVANSVHWLLTSAPDNMTGQVLHLDGGMSKLRN